MQTPKIGKEYFEQENELIEAARQQAEDDFAMVPPEELDRLIDAAQRARRTLYLISALSPNEQIEGAIEELDRALVPFVTT